MTEELIQTGLKVTINDLSQKLTDELTAKNLLAVQVTHLTEELADYQAVLGSDTALMELFQEAKNKLKEVQDDH